MGTHTEFRRQHRSLSPAGQLPALSPPFCLRAQQRNAGGCRSLLQAAPVPASTPQEEGWGGSQGTFLRRWAANRAVRLTQKHPDTGGTAAAVALECVSRLEEEMEIKQGLTNTRQASLDAGFHFWL